MAVARFSSLVIASHNPGKLREISALLEPLRIEVRSAAELGLPEPEETGDTFEANATLKSLAAATASGMHALSDDSGLVVPLLDGQPGIYSARWAGENKDFTHAMHRVERALRDRGLEPEGTPAYFVCVLALSEPGGHTHTFRGEIHGTLTFPPRGERGFGYDPLFIATGQQLTFGEIEPAHKHAMSHRAQAFSLFLNALKAQAA
jgi:XTP/dITP diphosphohydrolase